MSTPINQLPNVSNNDTNEKELVNEILKEINDNDTNQINMKEPPQDNIQINENNLNQEPPVMPLQEHVPEMPISQNYPDIPQNLESENYELNNIDVEPELSTIDRLKFELTNPLIVAGIIILVSVLTPHINQVLSPILLKSSILSNNSAMILRLLHGILGGLLFYGIIKYSN
jgi:hypothetical protein